MLTKLHLSRLYNSMFSFLDTSVYIILVLLRIRKVKLKNKTIRRHVSEISYLLCVFVVAAVVSLHLVRC